MARTRSARNPSNRKLPKPGLVAMRELPEVASWRAMMEGFRSVYNYLEKGLTADGWSMPRFQIILMLYFEGPQSQAELSRRFLVTRGNISTFCKRLIADGLIAYADDQTTKRPPLVLTAKGVALFEEIFHKHITRIRKRMIKFDPRLLEQLHQVAKGD